MDNFADAIDTGNKSILLPLIKDSLKGHLLVFAAEESKVTATIADIGDYEGKFPKASNA